MEPNASTSAVRDQSAAQLVESVRAMDKEQLLRLLSNVNTTLDFIDAMKRGVLRVAEEIPAAERHEFIRWAKETSLDSGAILQRMGIPRDPTRGIGRLFQCLGVEPGNLPPPDMRMAS